MIKNIKNKNSDKQLNRTNSFSKEISPTKEDTNKEDSSLSQSSRNINYLLRIQEKILGKPKEISQTILYEKIKRHSSSKGIEAPIIKLIAGQKDLLNLSNITKSINKKEDINVNKDNYLQVRKIKKISNEDFEEIRKEIAGYENLEMLYKETMEFQSFPLNEIDYHCNVGCLLSLEALIQSKYNDDPLLVEEMENRYNLYKDYIYNYRFIKGDGNCFYRAIIFRYIEIIILNKKIDLLKNLINEMKESFKSNEIRSRMRIKYDTILNINLILELMLIILELIENNQITDAHYFYVKSVNLYPTFDYGLIIFFRYIFYNYIKKNENKLYLENFPIKIGNLLPSKYETIKGEFLFNKFYYCYLLSMFTDAEKIIIYLTPFVLGINLDIIAFEDNEEEVIKNINFTGISEYDFNDDKIFVLNIKGHYELLYTENDNNKYKNIFEKYIYNENEDFKINEDNNNNQLAKSVNPNNNETKKDQKENEKTDDSDLKSNNRDNKLYSNFSPSKNTTNFNNKTEIKTNDLKNNNISKTAYKIKTRIITNKEQEFDNNNSKYRYNYSNNLNKNIKNNINKNNELNTNIIKRFNNTEKKQMNTLNIIYEKENSKTDDKSLRYKYKNKNILNSNNRNTAHAQNNENNLDVDIDEDIDIKQTKKSIIVKSMNLSNRINNGKNNNEGKQESYNKLSKILISPKKVGKENKSEEKIINTNGKKCKICSVQYNLKNSKEEIPNICYECLKNEILIQVYPNYLSYIENIMNNNFDKAFKNNFDIFLKDEININGLYISIENAIKELYNKNKENLNEAEEIDSLFREMKNKFCIFCSKEIGSEKFLIPCGCNFCCGEHIKKYFHLKNSIKNISNFVCICSHEYSNIDIYNLGLFFAKNRLFSLKLYVIDILNIHLSKQCCFCCMTLEPGLYQRINYKDLEENVKKNNILSDCSKIRHFICNICLETYYYKNETFYCNICNKNHIYCPN